MITLLSCPISLVIGFLFYSILLILIYTKIQLHLAAVCASGPCIELTWTGLDWTIKTRTSKKRTSKTRTDKTRTSKTRTGKSRTSETRTSKTWTGKRQQNTVEALVSDYLGSSEKWSQLKLVAYKKTTW